MMRLPLKIQPYHFMILLLSIFMSSCATYYQQNAKINGLVQKGELLKARELLVSEGDSLRGKNRVLHQMNVGWIDYALGNYKKSISNLNNADLYIEDYQKNYGAEALALVTNPGVKPYAPEDPEKVMVNYYKALSFLQLGDYQSALVEARRINQKLNLLNDKYKGHKNRYADDAFAHILMGLIYDATFDYNNAFIAYRNAVKAYDSIYTPVFGIAVPQQLKTDVLRTAYLNGFNEELSFFENKFGLKYEHKPAEGGTLVYFWENGFGPVKDEWSVNFSKMDGDGGMAFFQNSELGMSFPVFLGNNNHKSGSFSDFSMLRIAFPKYLQRPTVLAGAELKTSAGSFQFEKAEDLNAILFKTLEDRMLREMANSIARLAAKKAMEAAVREGDKNIGAVVGILNAVTEKADTRNWQTLPAEISYVKVNLPEGENTVSLDFNGGRTQQNESKTVFITRGKTVFLNFRSLETQPPQSRYGR
jgi:hypothetical protein